MTDKALILANLGPGFYTNEGVLPACFLPVYSSMTIIERLISLLNVNGFSNEDILILCGNTGIWNSKSVLDKLSNLSPRKIFVPKNDVINGDVFKDQFFNGNSLFIIEGNCAIDLAIISRLRRYHYPNVIVTDESKIPNTTKRALHIENGVAISINNQTGDYSWNTFAGIIKTPVSLIKQVIEKSNCDRSFMDLVDDFLKIEPFKIISYNDLVFGRLNGGYSEELTGGSYSKLNYRLVVKKESDENGRDKLINEIKWLLSIPPELKPYFSEVLEYDITSPHVFYNVPYYGRRNLREHIFDGHLDADSACNFLRKLLNWMFSNVYSRKINPAPADWVMNKHIRRVLERLPECSAKSPDFKKIIESKEVIVNGKKYRNVRELYQILSKNEKLLKRLSPRELVMIHGDLHFQNILLTNETDTGFILVDPRGESEGSDIYYDLGKLWHSFHAKYDFIHSDQFKYSISWKDEIPYTSYEITNKSVLNIYEEIHQKFNSIIQEYEYIRNDSDWELKILFAEASHLCSVSTFHINKTSTPERSIVMYLIGVQLINEFFDRFIPGQ